MTYCGQSWGKSQFIMVSTQNDRKYKAVASASQFEPKKTKLQPEL
jgi:hypothetical protein